jgi:hypothetical protein
MLAGPEPGSPTKIINTGAIAAMLLKRATHSTIRQNSSLRFPTGFRSLLHIRIAPAAWKSVPTCAIHVMAERLLLVLAF